MSVLYRAAGSLSPTAVPECLTRLCMQQILGVLPASARASTTWHAVCSMAFASHVRGASSDRRRRPEWSYATGQPQACGCLLSYHDVCGAFSTSSHRNRAASVFLRRLQPLRISSRGCATTQIYGMR